MKKCIVSAYFNNNLGDDLFVYTLIARYPNCLFYIDADRESVRFLKDSENIKIAPKSRKILRKIINKLVKQNKMCYTRNADALIKIGGSIFMEYNGWEGNWPVFKNNSFFILSANFGPYESDYFYNIVADRIKQVRDCCFRDKNSYNMFKNLNNVRCAPDVLFGAELPKNIKLISNSVGISVISLDNRGKLEKYAEEYYAGIAQFADELVEQGYSVCLYGFCVNEGDCDAIKKIKVYSKRAIDSEIYTGNINSFLLSFLSNEFIVASRFHAMILGWIAKRKVYPIIYSDKQKNIIKDMGYNIPFVEIENITTKITMKMINEMKSLFTLNVTHEMVEAEKQFAEIDKYIRDDDDV